ncbi:MAG: site-specific integrase [Actinomycetota bacterium]|nr:site-specific integrase [Actinomycetota bacterium]
MGGPRVAGVTGPLEVFEAGYVTELTGSGYVARVVQLQVQLMAELSRWLQSDGVEASDLGIDVAERFMAARRAAGLERHVTIRSLSPLLGYLVGIGVTTVGGRHAVIDPVEEVLNRYACYLRVERGLDRGTIAGYVSAVRPFVAEHSRPDSLAALSAADVTRFIVAFCPGRPPGPAKVIVTAMRSFLSWLHLEGTLAVPLAGAVPSVASRRLVGLPDPLSISQVRALLGACDRRSRIGRRDYAMIILFWRLGMRAGEVARLGMDDIDWHVGEVLVTGKGPKIERLPLPGDVGEAMAGWLQRGRPGTAVGRSVFVRVVAPHRALSPTGVTQAVFAVGQRAGLGTVRAHRLRHSAASGMLAAGATLPEIGRVLRHRRTLTTAIYAKVDIRALREVAAPWPGSGR